MREQRKAERMQKALDSIDTSGCEGNYDTRMRQLETEATKLREELDAWKELCGRWIKWPKLVREWERACSRYSNQITDDEPGEYPQPPPEKPEGV